MAAKGRQLWGCACVDARILPVQDEFLSGRENRVGSGHQQDFAGTLKERRIKYQDRRDVQGQESTRLIKRMREETGLEGTDMDDPTATAVRSASCSPHKGSAFVLLMP